MNNGINPMDPLGFIGGVNNSQPKNPQSSPSNTTRRNVKVDPKAMPDKIAFFNTDTGKVNYHGRDNGYVQQALSGNGIIYSDNKGNWIDNNVARMKLQLQEAAYPVVKPKIDAVVNAQGGVDFNVTGNSKFIQSDYVQSTLKALQAEGAKNLVQHPTKLAELQEKVASVNDSWNKEYEKANKSVVESNSAVKKVARFEPAVARSISGRVLNNDLIDLVNRASDKFGKIDVSDKGLFSADWFKKYGIKTQEKNGEKYVTINEIVQRARELEKYTDEYSPVQQRSSEEFFPISKADSIRKAVRSAIVDGSSLWQISPGEAQSRLNKAQEKINSVIGQYKEIYAKASEQGDTLAKQSAQKDLNYLRNSKDLMLRIAHKYKTKGSDYKDVYNMYKDMNDGLDAVAQRAGAGANKLYGAVMNSKDITAQNMIRDIRKGISGDNTSDLLKASILAGTFEEPENRVAGFGDILSRNALGDFGSNFQIGLLDAPFISNKRSQDRSLELQKLKAKSLYSTDYTVGKPGTIESFAVEAPPLILSYGPTIAVETAVLSAVGGLAGAGAGVLNNANKARRLAKSLEYIRNTTRGADIGEAAYKGTKPIARLAAGVVPKLNDVKWVRNVGKLGLWSAGQAAQSVIWNVNLNHTNPDVHPDNEIMEGVFADFLAAAVLGGLYKGTGFLTDKWKLNSNIADFNARVDIHNAKIGEAKAEFNKYVGKKTVEWDAQVNKLIKEGNTVEEAVKILSENGKGLAEESKMYDSFRTEYKNETDIDLPKDYDNFNYMNKLRAEDIIDKASTNLIASGGLKSMDDEALYNFAHVQMSKAKDGDQRLNSMLNILDGADTKGLKRLPEASSEYSGSAKDLEQDFYPGKQDNVSTIGTDKEVNISIGDKEGKISVHDNTPADYSIKPVDNIEDYIATQKERKLNEMYESYDAMFVDSAVSNVKKVGGGVYKVEGDIHKQLHSLDDGEIGIKETEGQDNIAFARQDVYDRGTPKPRYNYIQDNEKTTVYLKFYGDYNTNRSVDAALYYSRPGSKSKVNWGDLLENAGMTETEIEESSKMVVKLTRAIVGKLIRQGKLKNESTLYLPRLYAKLDEVNAMKKQIANADVDLVETPSGSVTLDGPNESALLLSANAESLSRKVAFANDVSRINMVDRSKPTEDKTGFYFTREPVPVDKLIRDKKFQPGAEKFAKSMRNDVYDNGWGEATEQPFKVLERNGKYYVLSGHSRTVGLEDRIKEKKPVPEYINDVWVFRGLSDEQATRVSEGANQSGQYEDILDMAKSISNSMSENRTPEVKKENLTGLDTDKNFETYDYLWKVAGGFNQTLQSLIKISKISQEDLLAVSGAAKRGGLEVDQARRIIKGLIDAGRFGKKTGKMVMSSLATRKKNKQQAEGLISLFSDESMDKLTVVNVVDELAQAEKLRANLNSTIRAIKKTKKGGNFSESTIRELEEKQARLTKELDDVENGINKVAEDNMKKKIAKDEPPKDDSSEPPEEPPMDESVGVDLGETKDTKSVTRDTLSKKEKESVVKDVDNKEKKSFKLDLSSSSKSSGGVLAKDIDRTMNDGSFTSKLYLGDDVDLSNYQGKEMGKKIYDNVSKVVGSLDDIISESGLSRDFSINHHLKEQDNTTDNYIEVSPDYDRYGNKGITIRVSDHNEPFFIPQGKTESIDISDKSIKTFGDVSRKIYKDFYDYVRNIEEDTPWA